MFKVTDTATGATLALVDSPNYVKKGANGCFVSADSQTTTAITINGGNLYALVGRGEVEGALGTVVVSQTDAGKMAMEQAAQLDYIAMMADVDLDVLTAVTTSETEVSDDEQ